MKLALLTTKLGIFCLISFSVSLSDVLAASQDTSSGSSTSFSSRFVNKSKPAPYVSRSLFRNKTAPVSTQNTVRLQAPPAPTSIVSPNQGKPVPTGASAGMQSNDQVVLQSRDIGSFGAKWQTFSDYLSVPKGCDQLPFYLTFTNGPGGGARFQDLRISLTGKSLGTLKDFSGSGSLTRNLTGALGVGDSLLTVQAYGPSGAQLNWKFTTPKIVVTKVNPNSFSPADKVTIEGRNFSDRANVTQVLIDNKPAIVVSAKSTLLQITPPKGLVGGKSNLVVMIGNQKSAPIQVTIKGAPEIQGVNMISTAPGQPLTITGTGFSPVSSENVVMIGPYQAEVVSVSPTSIQCIVPLGLDAMSPVYDLPVKVKTNNMESTDPQNVGRINIQSRVF